MRFYLFICFATFLFSCNSSSKKDSSEIMDDTARIDDKPGVQQVSGFTGAERMALTELPASIQIQGTATEAWKWNDSLGENILILSHVAPYDDKRKNEYGEEGQTASLHAAHYNKNVDKYTFVGQLNDEEKACPFDITCSFIPGSTTITDLNKNGYAEIKVQYSMACRSDVSPATMKLVITEKGEHFGLMGTMWLAFSPDMKFDVDESNVNLSLTTKLKDESAEMLRTLGRYHSEWEFKKAPPEFLPYARTEWLKYVKEKMGE
jgi:hypothetical protein